MSIQTQPLHVYHFHTNEENELEDVGIIDLRRCDSSVYSEQPEAWVCTHCSYTNVDGRNVFCAMCGTKNEKNSSLLEKNDSKPAQEGEIIFAADDINLMDTLSEHAPVENDLLVEEMMDTLSEHASVVNDVIVEEDICLLSTHPDETGFRSTQRSIIVPRLGINGPRPRMEDEDADDEAQPMKPSTGQSVYLSHQDDVGHASRTDDSSVLNGSACSSVATVASMSSAMANSVASSIANSVASSTATPRVSNRGYLPPSGTHSKDKMQTDISIASSTTTAKASNLIPLSAPLRSGATISQMNTPRAINAGNHQNDAFEASCSITSTATISSSRTVRSGIYSINEDQNIFVPPSMRAISMPVRPEESDALSTMSEPKKPIRTQESASAHLDVVDHTSKPPDSVRRKVSESSQNTESTAGRTSMSHYVDEHSPTAAIPKKSIPKATVLPLHHNSGEQEGDGDESDENNDKERRFAFLLFGIGSIVLLIGIVLMVALIPTKPQNVDFILPTLSSTSPPTVVDSITNDSSANIFHTPRSSHAPTLSSPSHAPTLSRPSHAPMLSPITKTPPSTAFPTKDVGALFVGKLEGVDDSRRIGHSVSLGGINGDVIAFVGFRTAGVSRFDAGAGSWSMIETMNSLHEDVPETARISLATEMDRLALAYNGRLEVHEYLESAKSWSRKLVLNDSLNSPTAYHSVVSMSGDGTLIAFLQPTSGLQTIDVRTWISYRVATTPNVDVLQVEVSHNGGIIAVLTENGVELKAPDPSNIWVDLVEPITDVKRATAISLSRDGKTLIVTSRTQTVIYSLIAGVGQTLAFTIEQGGIVLSTDYDGQLLAIGRSKDMLNANEGFDSISLYRRSIRDEVSTLEYDFLEDIELGDTPGASLSLLTTRNVDEHSSAIAIGLPLDGRKGQGSVRLYQVQHLSIK